MPFPAVVGRRPVEPNSITTELRPLAAMTRRGVRDTHDTQGVSQSACRGFLTIRMIWMHAGRRPFGCLMRRRVRQARYGERLIGKGYASEVVDDVIVRLIRVRLIDDEAYAQSAVRYCTSRLMGYRGAVMELKRKGVDRQLAQRVCDEAESQGVFAEAAWELGRRTARKTAGLDVEVRKRRFWSAGGRKGHNPEVLRKIAQELFV